MWGWVGHVTRSFKGPIVYYCKWTVIRFIMEPRACELICVATGVEKPIPYCLFLGVLAQKSKNRKKEGLYTTEFTNSSTVSGNKESNAYHWTWRLVAADFLALATLFISSKIKCTLKQEHMFCMFFVVVVVCFVSRLLSVLDHIKKSLCLSVCLSQDIHNVGLKSSCNKGGC